jgi:hypothetical protein
MQEMERTSEPEDKVCHKQIACQDREIDDEKHSGWRDS